MGFRSSDAWTGPSGESVGHRILEIGIPYHPEDVSEVPEAFYNRSLHTDNFPGYCMYSEGDNRAWFVADRNRECIGDISFLEKGGYIEDYGNGYEWCNIGDCYSCLVEERSRSRLIAIHRHFRCCERRIAARLLETLDTTPVIARRSRVIA